MASGFCIKDGFVYNAYPKGGYIIVIPDDKVFYYKLLYLHHNLPLIRHLGVFRIVKV